MTTIKNNSFKTRSTLTIVLLLAGLGHGIVSFFGGPTTPAPPDQNYLDSFERSPDEREYLQLAVDYVKNGELRLPTGDVAKRMPLYPWLLSLAYRTQPPEHWHSAALLMQGLLAWCNTILMALITLRLSDQRAACVAAVISALYFPFVFLAVNFLTETLVATFLLGAIMLYLAVFLSSGSNGKQLAGLAGVSVLLGLGALTRANMVLLILPFALHAVTRPGSWSRRGMCLAVIVLPACICLMPWVARNQQLLGSWKLSTIGGLNFHLGHNPKYADDPGVAGAAYGLFDKLRDDGLNEVEADVRLYQDGWIYIRENPGPTLGNCFTKVRTWFTPSSKSFGPTLPFFLLGVLLWCLRGEPETDSRANIRSFIRRVGLIVWLAISGLCALILRETQIPFMSAAYLLPFGLPALLLLRAPHQMRALLLGLYATQLAVAVMFIPLSRLRWTVDTLLIIAIGAGLSQLVGWVSPTWAQRQHANDNPPSP